eukprot:TRINITY_DN614_c0_g1_i1.p1 TRINITY_DN614_c0_g1~~TRINITY_DN614_c0_g1_i1.p1  ORF type:complete len:199 (+),score=55.12 TRINITY_DN614_c0_g1_i1:97-693(+)
MSDTPATTTTPETKTETTAAPATKAAATTSTPTPTPATTTPTTETKAKDKTDDGDEDDGAENKARPNLEEDEDVLFAVRAKLFFFRQGQHDDTKSWRERGVGEVKFLKHKETKKIRLLMRRDKTLKICLNHYLLPSMNLDINVGSDRSWVYTCPCEFSDEVLQEEIVAIRFANPDNANNFKAAWESAQKDMAAQLSQA